MIEDKLREVIETGVLQPGERLFQRAGARQEDGSGAQLSAKSVRLGMTPVLRLVAADAEYRQGLKRFTNDAAPELIPDDRKVRDASTAARQLALQPQDVLIDSFHVPPYASDSSRASGGSHRLIKASADRNTGNFGFRYNIGQEGGSTDMAAAIWVDFIPSQPSAQIQVRCLTPYDYVWRDLSYIATAHNDAGFGIYVLSFDHNGRDMTLEQNHRYGVWIDGTSWYEDHSNPGYPGTDFDHAFIVPETPYFNARPNRLYRAAIWCFGSGDAHGATTESASFSVAAIEASLPFVVIALK